GIVDFFDAAAGANPETITLHCSASIPLLRAGCGSHLVAYISHDGLMDFQLSRFPQKKNEFHRDAIILACASKQFFAEPLRASGAHPLLWTTGLMAPEAYTLKAALDGWVGGETGGQIRDRGATAYDKYQKCGLRAAQRLFASGGETGTGGVPNPVGHFSTRPITRILNLFLTMPAEISSRGLSSFLDYLRIEKGLAPLSIGAY